MVKHFELSSEKLIEAVKSREEIWNKNAKIYHQKDRKEAAWQNVCEELCNDWDELDENDKNNKLFMIKKRWNNIRDYYKKDLALQLNGSIGQPAMKRRKYMFSSQLDFMRTTFEKMLGKENHSDDDQEEYMIVNYSSDSDDNIPLKQDPEESNTSLKQNSEYSTSRKAIKKQVKASSSNIQTETQTDSTDDEGDLLFLKSLAPDMKSLSRRQKIDFKLGILQLYKKIITQSDPLYDGDEDKKFAM